jgi:cytidylate kinase
MIVTIDGPAGAGKSSAARALARRLGFEFLDTGAMYRAVALAARRAAVSVEDLPALTRLLADLRLEMPPGRVVLDGEDVTGLIRTPEIDALASKVAAVTVVRRHLAVLQRAIATGRDMVCEGRDQGTVVFPDARCKFFLVADPVERARRRKRERTARGESATLEDVLRAQESRDRRDAGRDVAPMVAAADAVVLDTTHLGPEEVVDRLAQAVRRCTDGSATSGTT